MPSTPAIGLRFRLMLLVILAMLPMFGLLLYRATQDRARKLREMEDDTIRTAEMSAASVSQVLEGAKQLLFSLSYAESVRALNGPSVSAHFARLLKNSSTFHNISLAQPDGVNIASARPNGIGMSRSDLPYFARLQQNRHFTIGEFMIGKITHQPTIILAYPLPDQPADQPVAAIYGALNLGSLQQCIAGHHLAQNSIITVVDRNGVELARNPNPEQWLGHKAQSWDLFEKQGGGTGFVETIGVDGVTRLYYRAPVTSSDHSLFVIVGAPKTAMLTAMRTSFYRDLLLLDILTLVALAGAWLFADYSVLQHVKRLTAASRQLAQGKWDVHARLPGGARELQQLGRAFDEMATTLREHRDRLELRVEQRTLELSRANNSLKQEIEERKQAQAMAHMLMGNLERSNKELEQFAYVASHDLQEPLRLVSSYTQLLLQRYKEKLDAEAGPITQFITEGVARMQQLIQDLLAYSRVSNQGQSFALADANIALESALRNLAMLIREQNAVITHDPLPTLLCDSNRLAQVFQNLISNGIKFRSEAPPCIHVGARKTEDESAWIFSVSDNGIGIEQDYFERIFVIFQRLHTRSKYPGTGIGLAICKRIVEQHGGKIWVESAKGNGCTFYFTIAINPNTL